METRITLFILLAAGILIPASNFVFVFADLYEYENGSIVSDEIFELDVWVCTKLYNADKIEIMDTADCLDWVTTNEGQKKIEAYWIFKNTMFN